jgi:predicted nucleic acid-binding Zn ribbon protein
MMSGRRLGKNIRNTTELMETVARDLKLSGLVRRHRLFVEWEKIVGPRLAAVCQPHEIKGKTLMIMAADSSWGHDIKMHAVILLEKIAEVTGNDSVKKLRVTTGPLDPPLRLPDPPPDIRDIEVETADIETELDQTALKDKPAARALLAQIWADSRRLKKARQESPR